MNKLNFKSFTLKMSLIIKDVWSANIVKDAITLNDIFVVSYGGLIARYDKDFVLIDKTAIPNSDHLLKVNEFFYGILRNSDVVGNRIVNSKFVVFDKKSIKKLVKCNSADSSLKGVLLSDLGVTAIYFKDDVVREETLFDSLSFQIENIAVSFKEELAFLLISIFEKLELLSIKIPSGKILKTQVLDSAVKSDYKIFSSHDKSFLIAKGDLMSLGQKMNFIISLGKLPVDISFTIDLKNEDGTLLTLIFISKSTECYIFDNFKSYKFFQELPYVFNGGSVNGRRVLCYNSSVTVLFEYSEGKLILIKEEFLLPRLVNVNAFCNYGINILREDGGFKYEKIEPVLQISRSLILPANEKINGQKITFIYKINEFLLIAYDNFTRINDFSIEDLIVGVWVDSSVIFLHSITTVYEIYNKTIFRYRYKGSFYIHPNIGPILLNNNVITLPLLKKSWKIVEKKFGKLLEIIGGTTVKSKNGKGVSSSSFNIYYLDHKDVKTINLIKTDNQLQISDVDSFSIEETSIDKEYCFYKKSQIPSADHFESDSELSVFKAIKQSFNKNSIVRGAKVYSFVNEGKARVIDLPANILNSYSFENSLIANTSDASYLVDLEKLKFIKLEKSFSYVFAVHSQLFGCSTEIERFNIVSVDFNHIQINLIDTELYSNSFFYSRFSTGYTGIIIHNDVISLISYQETPQESILLLNNKKKYHLGGLIVKFHVFDLNKVLLVLKNECKLLFIELSVDGFISIKKQEMLNEAVNAITNSSKFIVVGLLNKILVFSLEPEQKYGLITIRDIADHEITDIVFLTEYSLMICFGYFIYKIEDVRNVTKGDQSFHWDRFIIDKLGTSGLEFTKEEMETYQRFLKGEIDKTNIVFDREKITNLISKMEKDSISTDDSYLSKISHFSNYIYRYSVSSTTNSHNTLFSWKDFKLEIDQYKVSLPDKISSVFEYQGFIFVFGESNGCYVLYEYTFPEDTKVTYEKSLKSLTNWDQEGNSIDKSCFSLIDITPKGRIKTLLGETNNFLNFNRK